MQMLKQFCTDALEGLFEQVKPITKSLITRQQRKPIRPITDDKIIDLFLLKFVIKMPEKPDADEFLVGKVGFRIITCTLKASLEASIVNLTDKQI